MSDVRAIDRYDNSATRQVIALGGRLGRRINALVDAFIADLARDSASASQWRHLVHVTAGTAEIYNRGKAGEPQFVGSFEGALPVQVVKKLAGRGKRLMLRLGTDRAVVKVLSLPEGARAVLGAVVRNKVESLAPWPLEEAIWGFRELVQSQSGQIRVEIGIASRKNVEALLAALGQKGITAEYLEIAGDAMAEVGIAIDFHSAARLERARNLVKTTLLCTGVVATLACAFGLYGALAARAELAAIELRSQQLTTALRAGPAGAGAGKLAVANTIHERKKAERPLIEILNTLTGLVPDGIFLKGFDYEDKTVTLTGRGLGASEVIGRLESSEAFAAAAFSSATQRDPNSNEEVFTISTSVEAAGALP